MSDTNSATRIVDLPDSNSGKLPQYTSSAPSSGGFSGTDTYVPLNIHPNPYGNMPPQSSIMQHPNPTTVQGQPHMLPPPPSQMPPMNYMTQDGNPQYPLPSRDIPMDTAPLIQDEMIKANYIPPSTRSNLGIMDDEDDWFPKKKEKKNKKVHFEDDWFQDWQRPILIAMLFFLFQMPMLTVLMFKYMTFLKMFDADGNMNYTGFILKSIFFGAAVYGLELLLQNSKE